MRWLADAPDDTLFVVAAPKFEVADACFTVVSTIDVVVAGVAASVQVRYGVKFCDARLMLAVDACEREAPMAAAKIATVAHRRRAARLTDRQRRGRPRLRAAEPGPFRGPRSPILRPRRRSPNRSRSSSRC